MKIRDSYFVPAVLLITGFISAVVLAGFTGIQVSQLSTAGSNSDGVVFDSSPTVEVEGGKLRGTVTLHNQGTTMDERDIVVMNVERRALNFISRDESSCSDSGNLTVHKEYSLAKGETAKLVLETSQITSDGVYYVSFKTRESCEGSTLQNLGSTHRVQIGETEKESTVNRNRDLRLFGAAAVLALFAGSVAAYRF